LLLLSLSLLATAVAATAGDATPAAAAAGVVAAVAPLQVRPLIGIERAAACESIMTYPSAVQVQLAGAHTFTYDHAFAEDSTQAEVYEACAAPLVRAFFEGFNATILAYGQTGSGSANSSPGGRTPA